jgi:hypothetical protein
MSLENAFAIVALGIGAVAVSSAELKPSCGRNLRHGPGQLLQIVIIGSLSFHQCLNQVMVEAYFPEVAALCDGFTFVTRMCFSFMFP